MHTSYTRTHIQFDINGIIHNCFYCGYFFFFFGLSPPHPPPTSWSHSTVTSCPCSAHSHHEHIHNVDLPQCWSSPLSTFSKILLNFPGFPLTSLVLTFPPMTHFLLSLLLKPSPKFNPWPSALLLPRSLPQQTELSPWFQLLSQNSWKTIVQAKRNIPTSNF